MLTQDELKILRTVSVQKILGIPNAGRIIHIKCPFHMERSPSCAIYPNGGYYCFGCEKRGQGALDFLIDTGISFRDALKEVVQFV